MITTIRQAGSREGFLAIDRDLVIRVGGGDGRREEPEVVSGMSGPKLASLSRHRSRSG